MLNGENKITIPSWLINSIISVLLPLVINIGFFMYWAGRTSAQQDATAVQLRQLREDIQQLRAQVDELNKRSSKD